MARFWGEQPQMIAVVAERDGEEAALASPGASAFFLAMCGRAPAWENAITRRSLEMVTEYEPGLYVDRIGETSLLMVVAMQDTITPADLALAAFDRATGPKKLVKFVRPLQWPALPRKQRHAARLVRATLDRMRFGSKAEV